MRGIGGERLPSSRSRRSAARRPCPRRANSTIDPPSGVVVARGRRRRQLSITSLRGARQWQDRLHGTIAEVMVPVLSSNSVSTLRRGLHSRSRLGDDVDFDQPFHAHEPDDGAQAGRGCRQHGGEQATRSTAGPAAEAVSAPRNQRRPAAVSTASASSGTVSHSSARLGRRRARRSVP